MKKAFFCSLLAATFVFATRYQAQNATFDNAGISDPTWVAMVISNEAADGGQYVQMGEGSIAFDINITVAGPYDVWVNYSNTYGGDKTQNITINGAGFGAQVFPETGTSLNFERIKIVAGRNFSAGAHTIGIQKNWGWIDVDYIEVVPFEETTQFNITTVLATPNASERAKEMYAFLLENFGKKTISGVMTGASESDVAGNLANQTEVAYIASVSGGKMPALLGFDFMHTTYEESWSQSYTNSLLRLTEELYNMGGIPIYNWHWRNPNRTDHGFFANNQDPQTTFDIATAFTDYTFETFNTGSTVYNNIIRDIDLISGHLKTLADKGIPVLWRPLHEAAGGWFWWGRDKRPNPNKKLWILMFDRMVNHHGLNNLIWVWTCEEGATALDWYPGDQYVDIIGRDFYASDNNYGSLSASFQNLKEIYGGKKIIALSENGPIPHPNNMQEDGAYWSFFMPWYDWYTKDASQNPASHWQAVMNHSFVLTLDDMPGWNGTTTVLSGNPQNSQPFDITAIDFSKAKVYDMHGKRVAANSFAELKNGVYIVKINGIAKKIAVNRQ